MAPAFANLQIGSKQPEASVSVGVRNNFSTPVTLSADLSGLKVRNNSLLPENQTDEALEKLTTITPALFELGSGESINLNVNIKDSADLKPGGHYLSVLIKQISSNSQKLTLESAVSVTVYVIKEDGAVRKLGIKQINNQHNVFSLPKFTDITYFNPGNVAIVPRGAVFVTNIAGNNVYYKGLINSESVPLFPGQEIRLRTELGVIEPTSFPGRYKLTVQYRYEYQDDFNTVTTMFWHIPKRYVLVVLLILVMLIWLSRPKHRLRVAMSIKRAVPKFIKLSGSRRSNSLKATSTTGKNQSSHVKHPTESEPSKKEFPTDGSKTKTTIKSKSIKILLKDEDNQ